jgi:hypothetical protein
MLKVAIFMGRVILSINKKTGGHMPRSSLAIVALAFGFSTTAFAQTLTAEQQAACKADYQKYCKGTIPGGGRIIACLNKQVDQISAACRKVLDAAQPK